MDKPKIEYRGTSEALPLNPNTPGNPYRALSPTTVVVMNAHSKEEIAWHEQVDTASGTTIVSITRADRQEPTTALRITPGDTASSTKNS